MVDTLPATRLQLGKLCSTCRNIFDTWDQIVEKSNFYFQFESLEGSPYGLPFHKDAITWRGEIENGCVLCMRLFDSLKEEPSRKVVQSPRSGEVEIHLSILPLDFGVSLKYRNQSREKGGYHFWVTVEWAGDDEPLPRLDGGIALLPRPVGTYMDRILPRKL